ncbi:hypothetical protein [Dankookia sp. P2]|uniref:hypothetical protein n=1 Tax=Dankookia sp. P2 TaxID=3423955 RepID=UPI003D664080
MTRRAASRPAGLRRWLLALVFLALCPALLVGLLTAWQSATAQRAVALARLAEAATVLATALDREVEGLAATSGGPAAVRNPVFASAAKAQGILPALPRLQALLGGPGLPPGAVALLLDDRGGLVAGTAGRGDALAALPVPPLGPAAPRRTAGRDGQPRDFAQAALAAIPGWTLLVAQPAAAIDAAGRHPILVWGLGALLAAAMAGLLALGFAAALRRPLTRLLAQAGRLVAEPDPAGDARPPPRAPVVAELAALEAALQAAAATLRARLLEAARAAAEQAAALERQVAERDGALAAARAEAAREGALRRREEAQAALLQAQKLQALGALAGRVAHGFNTALASMVGSYRLIERRVTDPALLQAVEDGGRAAERTAALLRELVEFAQREELRPVPLELPGLLAEVREMVHYTIGKGLSVVVELPPGLWPVLADPHRLEAALLNLAALSRAGCRPAGRC